MGHVRTVRTSRGNAVLGPHRHRRSAARARAAVAAERYLPRWAHGPLRALPRAPLRRRTARLRGGHRPPVRRDQRGRRAALAALHPHQVVHLDLPDRRRRRRPVRRGLSDAARSGGTTACWSRTTSRRFYVYRMGYNDDTGRLRQTTGVIGALELAEPGEGGVLPHEQTTPKAKSDRLDLLRASKANLSAVWGLSPATGLTDLCDTTGAAAGRLDRRRRRPPPPVGHHPGRRARHDRPAPSPPRRSSSPTATTATRPRSPTATSAARRGDGAGRRDLAMTYVVELVEEQLMVLPIHRLVDGLPDGFDLLAALERELRRLRRRPASAPSCWTAWTTPARCAWSPSRRGSCSAPAPRPWRACATSTPAASTGSRRSTAST